MASSFSDLINNFKEIPLSRKIASAAVIFLVVAGMGSIFLWANKQEYKVVYTNLTAEDSVEVVEKLKELKIPYKFERNESVILVPEDKIHEARLGLAGAGLPKSGVGFEIFDKTDFGTTEFVQQLNYQRALQGELARTIKEMDEVKDARVLIVLPKDSVFVEDVKPPSASVFLKLRSKLPPGKVEAVVHLVASAVEDLTPDLVTVVDSDGKVLSKGMGEDESNTPLNKQLEYKLSYEKNMAGRIQTMLEEIVGPGKAIVRVTADMDFAQVDVNEEIYDPDAQVIRSRQNIADQSNKQNVDNGRISSVNPIGNQNQPLGLSEVKQHNDETVNYEISKTVRVTQNPVGTVLKLSVAAVLDGTYKREKNDKGIMQAVYVPRAPEDLARFATIVRQAMGYSADREDQVSVESIPFSSGDVWTREGETAGFGFKWTDLKTEYGRPVANILMILLLFLFVVRPLVRTYQQVTVGDEELLGGPEEPEQLIFDDQGRPMLPKPRVTTIQDKAMILAREDINRAANIIKGWLSEGED
jgi:flagellar M-ring protein FliF